jgi:hypothetical protein
VPVMPSSVPIVLSSAPTVPVFVPRVLEYRS